jgi:hypothetical protein
VGFQYISALNYAYSEPGKELFYRKLGFKRMSTAMAIFENQDQALERGYVNEKL